MLLDSARKSSIRDLVRWTDTVVFFFFSRSRSRSRSRRSHDTGPEEYIFLVSAMMDRATVVFSVLGETHDINLLMEDAILEITLLDLHFSFSQCTH